MATIWGKPVDELRNTAKLSPANEHEDELSYILQNAVPPEQSNDIINVSS